MAADDALKKALAYLKDIPEVEWVEFERDAVYIGWESLPPDFRMINRAAAMIGNRTVGRTVRVWSVRGFKGWRPGNWPHLCKTTARGGVVKDSSC